MKYFDVEERMANVSPDSLVLTAERAKPLIDEVRSCRVKRDRERRRSCNGFLGMMMVDCLVDDSRSSGR